MLTNSLTTTTPLHHTVKKKKTTTPSLISLSIRKIGIYPPIDQKYHFKE
jgi:hypothetical protein